MTEGMNEFHVDYGGKARTLEENQIHRIGVNLDWERFYHTG